MKTENKYFVIFLAAAAMMVAGVIYENALSVFMPPRITIDAAKVRKAITEAKLVPQEARYWQEVP
jgi:hypothetical protein